MDIHALIADAKREARSVELCLRGDVVADLEEATRALALAAANEDAQAMASITDRITDLRRTMAKSTLTVRLAALPKREWVALLAEHPPREDVATDARMGFNPETLYDAIIKRSWQSPEASPTDIDALLDQLNAGQFNELADAAWAVNASGAKVPPTWRPYSASQR